VIFAVKKKNNLSRKKTLLIMPEGAAFEKYGKEVAREIK
jgi:hypothetical protein